MSWDWFIYAFIYQPDRWIGLILLILILYEARQLRKEREKVRS